MTRGADKPPSVILHPFLISLYPLLHCFARQQQIFPGEIVIRPAVCVLGAMALLWFVLNRVCRNLRKSAVLTSVIILFVSSYEVFPDSRYTLLGWLLLLMVIGSVILRLRSGLGLATIYLNIFAVVLMAMPLLTMLRQANALASAQPELRPLPAAHRDAAASPLPNIYYLVLDSYARADVLETFFQYDNAPFLTYLRNKGFRVASASQTNYNQTMTSLASSLNAAYLDTIVETLGPDAADIRPLCEMIKRNRVAKCLKQLGYRSVVFPASFPWIGPSWSLSRRDQPDRYLTSPWLLSGLEHRLIRDSVFPALLRFTPFDQYRWHRESLLYIFDRLPAVAQSDAPVFVFAHILSPHRPFVLGEARYQDRPFSLVTSYTEEEHLRGYVSEVAALNQKLMETIDAILRNNRAPPIIVVQSDHGSRLTATKRGLRGVAGQNYTNAAEQLPILNAYYLPNGGSADLYETISPVNTFRVILSRYFGVQLERLSDESYISSWERPYQFRKAS